MWLIYARKRCATHHQIESVKWRQTDNQAVSRPTWTGDEQIVSVGKVVDALRAGEQVGTLFQVEGQVVLGPEVVIGTNERGQETISVSSWPNEGQRSLFSLPEFE